MEFSGKVIVLNQPTGGTSKSGNVWKKQELIIEQVDGGQYPESIALEIFGEERIAKFDVHMGDIVDVKFNSRATSYNGRCFNQHQIWSLTKQGGNNNYHNNNAPTQQAANFGQPTNAPAPDSSSLPF